MSVALLSVRDLQTHFPLKAGLFGGKRQTLKAVDGVSFDLAEREVLGICGESGSGKTTLGRSVLRLVEPSAGSIRFQGQEVTGYGPGDLKRYRRQAQMVFQDPFGALNPRMTVEAILAEPLRIQGLAETARARREKAVEMLELVSLSADYLRRKPHDLSGGQRQRIVIARALAVGPRMVVADEPVSALDVSIQAQIIALLTDLKERLDLAMLFISHDLAVMEYLSDRIAVVYLGRIMEIGPASAICTRPQHPYSRALLSSVVSIDPAARRQRMVLQGELPNQVDPPSGCVFRTRCPFAIAACAEARPELREVAPGQRSACIRDDLPSTGFATGGAREGA